MPHEMVHQPLNHIPRHASGRDLIALQENADGADEGGDVAGADDVFVFEKEFEVGEGAVGGGEEGGGDGGEVAEVEGLVEVPEDVAAVDGGEGALGGAFAVDAAAGGLAAGVAGLGEGGGEEGEGEEEGG